MLHVSLATRRGAPFAPEVMAAIERMQALQSALPRPGWIGRRIGIRR
jgi:hypothetical protein